MGVFFFPGACAVFGAGDEARAAPRLSGSTNGSVEPVLGTAIE